MRDLVIILVIVAAAHAVVGQRGCRYGRGDGSVQGDCDPVTNRRPVTLVLKNGRDTCPPTKEVQRACRRPDLVEESDESEPEVDRESVEETAPEPEPSAACSYVKSSDEVECDRNTRTKTVQMTLASGDPDRCEATKVVTKPCGGGGRRRPAGRRNRGRGNQPRVIQDENGCSFGKGDGFSIAPCEEGDTTHQVTLVLVEGEDTCPATMVIDKPCGGNGRPGHSGRRGNRRQDRTERREGREERQRVRAERREQREQRRTNTASDDQSPEGCEYSRGNWSECISPDDITTGRGMLISSEDDVQCPEFIYVTQTCAQLVKEQRKEAKQARNQQRQARRHARRERKEEKQARKLRKQAERQARRAARRSSSQTEDVITS